LLRLAKTIFTSIKKDKTLGYHSGVADASEISAITLATTLENFSKIVTSSHLKIHISGNDGPEQLVNV
jgi:hypothetical protein